MPKVKEEISIKNTKQEILDALNEALDREKELKKVKSNPIEEQEVKEKQAAVKETKENVENNLFSEQLNEKFNKLQISLSYEEQRLKDLYGIEDELNNLTVVVNAHKDIMLKLDKEKEEKERAISEKTISLENDYKEKESKLKEEYDTLAATLKKERERENEEYLYSTKRNREIENNKWNDEKKQRLDEINMKEAETNKLLAEAKENEDKFNELAKKVEEIPAMLAKEYERSKTETTKELNKDFKYEKDLLIAEYKNTIDRQNDKIESLESEITRLTEINSSLQQKMDKAYSELKELATKTVEANGGVKIIGNNNQQDKI